MNAAGRKSLPHGLPWFTDSSAIQFITICARNRAESPLLNLAPALLDSLKFYHEHGKWWLHLAVIMPDHIHFNVSFPPESALHETIVKWKHWTAAKLEVNWQRDFFDRRLRSDENLRDKSDYILQNPVRADLVTRWQDWPHLWIAER